MAEGDTIYRIAEVLRRALLGAPIVRAHAQPRPGMRRVPDLEQLVGSVVSSVEARGKHLLIGFDNGLTLRTHLRMRGAWHRYRVGEPWSRPASQASAVLETPTTVAVCFDAPEVELMTDAQVARHPQLTALGPDLLSRSFDADEAARRLASNARRPIGEALLDQRLMAGVGNVYKSEICFIEGVSPWRAIGELDAGTIAGLVTTAHRLLGANVGGGARVTTGQQRPGRELWVYGRAGRPCRRCGTLVQGRRQGEQARMTYWCPRCQR
ncbi:MAG TPA: DNA-formamidopyrimidine glycosylase family protein [Candidatus Limnocylindria bacterium]|nr:DNA-formamidopyrimidine glycosylase family protein [Candidatus Limnocylindria bacterium]